MAIHSRIPAHIRINRYGAPRISSIVGAHHDCFSRRDGLASQATAPSNPPIIEMVAAGLCCRTHEQTVSLLKTITTTASAISRPNAIQLPFALMPNRTRVCPCSCASTWSFATFVGPDPHSDWHLLSGGRTLANAAKQNYSNGKQLGASKDAKKQLLTASGFVQKISLSLNTADIFTS